ncbi:MAG: hypothetical protein QHH75_07555 [Bacillota bacterium]|nr:hypothetical protein [Bacillota bacterium]
MDKAGEMELAAKLNGLGVPEDLTETVLHWEPAPDAAALERIRARTLEKVNRRTALPPVRTKRRQLQVAAAAVLFLAAILTLWAGPSRVWAGVRKVLTLLPGFSLMEEREEWGYALAAVDKYRQHYGEGYVELAGLLAHGGGTYLNLYFSGIPGYAMPGENMQKQDREAYYEAYHAQLAAQAQKIYLLDETGKKYRREKAPFSFAGSSRESHAWLWLPPLPPDTRRVTVVVPVAPGEELRFSVPLVDVKSAGGEGEETVGITLHDITVVAAPHYGEDTWFSLLVIPPHPDIQLAEIGRYYPSLPAPRPVALVGAAGREYRRLSRGSGSLGNNFTELFFERVDAAETTVTLEIPLLLLKDKGQGKVTVPVPGAGETIEFMQRVSLGRFTVGLTTVERVSYPHEDSLKIYVDLGPAGEETLEYFSLKDTSWGYTVDEVTGRMLYFEVPLQGSPQKVKLTLQDPVYSVEGPWTFTFPVLREEASR